MRDTDKGMHALRELVQHLASTDTHVVVGVLGEDATAHDDSGITIAGLAAVHEYGAMAGPGRRVRIPERAPIRKTLDAREGEIAQAASRLLESVVDGQATVPEALARLGLFTVSQIQRTIQAGVEPANAQSTIDRKRSSKPLIDTGLLVRSFTHQVRGSGS